MGGKIFMEANERLIQLIVDEEFQDDILNSDHTSDDERKGIIQKYSITEKEYTFAFRFLSGISLRNEKLSPEDVNYALKRLMSRVANTSDLLTIKSVKITDYFTWISRIAAVLAIPLLLTTLYFYQESRKAQSEYFTSSSQHKVSNTFQASLGARTQVVLPDGSLVWLNSGSALSCPAVFDSRSRNVELKGEAYFEVVKIEKIPMIVSSGDLKVKVYGTKFNVNAYPDEKQIITTLVEGIVTIIPGDSRKEHQLSPGYTASYTVEDKKLQISKVEDMNSFTGWKDGKLLFHNESFAYIIKRLERWYNAEIQLTDSSLGAYTLYATFFDESIEQILDIFSRSIPIKIEYPKRVKNPDGVYSKRQIIIKRDTSKKIKMYKLN
jgi:transmembrane sensor